MNYEEMSDSEISNLREAAKDRMNAAYQKYSEERAEFLNLSAVLVKRNRERGAIEPAYRPAPEVC